MDIVGAVKSGADLLNTVIGLFKKPPPTEEQIAFFGDVNAMASRLLQVLELIKKDPEVKKLYDYYLPLMENHGGRAQQLVNVSLQALGKLPKMNYKSPTWQEIQSKMELLLKEKGDAVGATGANLSHLENKGTPSTGGTPFNPSLSPGQSTSPNQAGTPAKQAGFFDSMGSSIGVIIAIIAAILILPKLMGGNKR